MAMARNGDVEQASEVGWFAARQPGLIRFLEDRVGHDGDAMAMSVDMCWRVASAFERQRGLPLPRLRNSDLTQAEVEVVSESQGAIGLANGCAHRQPELCRWLEETMADPGLPIDNALLDQVALVTAATISACDRAQTSGLAPTGPAYSLGALIE